MKIIFADDNKTARKIVLKLLEDKDFSILVAENGNQAWELLNQSNARIVITDWHMPGLNGLELCRKIRKEFTESYIYIILVTSEEDEADVVEALNAGADDFLLKPLRVDELNARIRSGLRIIKLEDEQKMANTQLLQSEKMASVGQLAAGVAHEINNPTGFVSSNLRTLVDYQKDIRELLEKNRDLITRLNESRDINLSDELRKLVDDIAGFEKEVDIGFIMGDFTDLIEECRDGVDRIKKIVSDLKDFAHPGQEEMQFSDINKCIESTLNVIWNEVKYKAMVQKKFGDIPLVTCYPQQLNQVFMNIIINAVHAIETMGEIEISTDLTDGCVRVIIRDNGCGIEKEHLTRIFDPFFTTKEVGKGTGLGMNVAFNIIQKHNGRIEVESEVGQGTVFTILLPAE